MEKPDQRTISDHNLRTDRTSGLKPEPWSRFQAAFCKDSPGLAALAGSLRQLLWNPILWTRCPTADKHHQSHLTHSIHPVWPVDPKETDCTYKETTPGTVGKLASTFQENRGWVFCLFGCPDKNRACAPKGLTERTIPQHRWGSECSNNRVIFLPMLVPPGEGLGLPNSPPAAALTFLFLLTVL